MDAAECISTMYCTETMSQPFWKLQTGNPTTIQPAQFMVAKGEILSTTWSGCMKRNVRYSVVQHGTAHCGTKKCGVGPNWIFFHWICTAQRTGCVKTGSRGRWAGAVLNGPALRSLHAPEEPAHSFMHTQSMIKHMHSMETDVLNIICNFWIAWHWKNNGGEGLIVSIEEAWIVGIIR